MKRLATLAMTAAILAGVIGALPSHAASGACVPTGVTVNLGQFGTVRDDALFKSCGRHLPMSRLPFTFRYDAAGAPSSLQGDWEIAQGIGVDEVVGGAIQASMMQWDAVWPLKRAGTCNVLCLGNNTSVKAGNLDGVNVVGWGSPSDCNGEPDSDTFARTCVWYYDADTKKRIKEVDIILNPAWKWTQAEEIGADDTAGAARGALGTASGDSVDLESVLTHEFGHAIGLEDIGADDWPRNLAEAAAAQQTMYHEAKYGQTNKRTIDAGDIAGAQYQAMLSALDG